MSIGAVLETRRIIRRSRTSRRISRRFSRPILTAWRLPAAAWCRISISRSGRRLSGWNSVIRPVLRSPRRIPGSRLRRLAPARHPVRLQAPAPEPGDPPGNKPRLNFSSKRNRAFFQRNARFSLAMFKQKKVNSVHFSGLINRGYSHDTSTFPLPSARIRSFVSVIRPIRV